MSIVIRPFKAKMIESFEFRPAQLGIAGRIDMQAWQRVERAGIAVAGFEDCKCLMIGGAEGRYDWCAELWVLVSKRVKPRHKFKMVRLMHEYVGLWNETYRRLHCTVHSADARAIRLTESLGFRREGVLRSYGYDGSDHVILSRIRACPPKHSALPASQPTSAPVSSPQSTHSSRPSFSVT